MELVNGDADKNSISKITDTIHKMNEARLMWNRQALINVMFLYGKQHFNLSRANQGPSVGQRIVWELENQKNKDAIRCTSNYILPLFRSVYSRLIRQKANVHAQPTTSTQEDRDAARVSKEVAEDFWQNCNRNNPWLRSEFTGMQAVLMRLILYKMTIGIGHLVPYFNPKSKAFVYQEPRQPGPGQKGNIFEADVGNAEVRVVSPLNMFKDRFQRFAIERRFISPEQVWDEYGVDVAPSDVDEDDTEVKIRRMLEGTDAEKMDKDGVYVYRKLCVPSKEYKNGRELVCTDKEILYDGELPTEARSRIQNYEFRYQDLGFCSTGQGIIEQVVGLQQDYNFNLSRIKQHTKLMAGKILVPRGADGGNSISSKFDDIIGQIIFYTMGRKPTMETPPPVPDHYYKNLMQIRNDMEGLMNSHDVSLGRDPSQVKSGVGISNLAEIDNSQIAPELVMFEQKLGFFAEAVLDIAQEKYNEPRLLSISGEDMALEVKSFIGSDLMGQKNVQIKMGSNFPLDPTQRTQYILMLKHEGFISPEKAKELLEFDDIDGAFNTLDMNGAKQDILNIIDGQEVIIDPMHPMGGVAARDYEDHTTYLKVINDFRKGTSYQKLDPMIRAKIDEYASQHQQMLLSEQRAAAEMNTPKIPPKPEVSESMSFKDLPIDGKIQMAAKAGITLNPHGLILQEHTANKPKEPAPGAGAQPNGAQQ